MTSSAFLRSSWRRYVSGLLANWSTRPCQEFLEFQYDELNEDRPGLAPAATIYFRRLWQRFDQNSCEEPALTHNQTLVRFCTWWAFEAIIARTIIHATILRGWRILFRHSEVRILPPQPPSAVSRGRFRVLGKRPRLQALAGVRIRLCYHKRALAQSRSGNFRPQSPFPNCPYPNLLRRDLVC
jgi:hypothetical protein